MIVAYYPGAGGNRYLQLLKNKDFKCLGISYDGKFPELINYDRYLLSDQSYNEKYILTHCVNYDKINQVFGSSNITFIKADYKKSLRRAWILNESHKINFSPVDSIWSFICWHDEYYLKYPFQTNGSNVIDIEADNTIFSNVIKTELLEYHNPLFDFCWDIYYSQGALAPINDLYNELYDK
jgi:hypothetical protein